MAKFSGPSVLPGAQLKLPLEDSAANIPTEQLFAPVTPTELPSKPEDNPFLLGTEVTGEALAPEINEDIAVEPSAPVDNVSQTLIEGATTDLDTQQRELDRVPSILSTLGVTSLDPDAVNKNMPYYQALQRGENFNKVFQEKVAGTKVTKNIRYTPESLALAKQTGDDSVLVETGFTETAFEDRATSDIQPTAPIKKGSLVNVGTQALMFQKDLLDASIVAPDGNMVIDPELGRVMSLTVEQSLLQSMFQADNNVDQFADVKEGTDPEGNIEPFQPLGYKFTKAKGNEKLGRDIYRNWKRVQAEQKGLDTDSYVQDYDQVSSEAFTFLGDQAKEVYAESNPDVLYREPVLQDGQVIFTLQPNGVRAIEVLRNKAKGFMAQPEVKPNLAPTETGKKETEAKTYTRNVTTVLGKMGDTSIVDEAMVNANKTAFINDPRREALVFMLGTSAIINSLSTDPNQQTYASIFQIGTEKFKEAEAEKRLLFFAAKRAAEQGLEEKSKSLQKLAENYNPNSIIQEQREKFLNVIGGAAEYSGKANHLTFALQALTGRIHDQQTVYSPQAHKLIRFLTGSGNIYQFKPNTNGEIERNWKEILSTKLYEKAFKKDMGFSRSAEERIRIFDQEALTQGGLYSQYVRWGNQLLTATANFNTENSKQLMLQLREVVKAPESAQSNQAKADIKQRIRDEYKDELGNDLKTFLGEEKEEAILYADYFMDLAKWDNANKTNTIHKSSIIAEIDGKTHGPATMAMLLGSVPIAKRSGTLTPAIGNITAKLDEYKDLRDAMADTMRNKVDAATGIGGIPENQAPIYREILEFAIKDKERFLKKSPMTMGYGQDLVSLQQHVDATVFQGGEITQLINQNGLDQGKVINFLHSLLVDSIYETFDPETLQINQVVKSNAQLSVLTENVLSFKNAMGFTSYLSAKETDPENVKQSSFEFKDPRRKVTVQFYKTKTSPSAVRKVQGKDQVGGRTVGLSLPVPVQSYDGNMVGRTLSGGSYNRIQSDTERLGGSNTFALPIFDAFIVDLGSFSAVRAEANKHHKESLMNHDYTQTILDDWYNETMTKVNAMNDSDTINWQAASSLQPGAAFKGLAHLFTEVSGTGKSYSNLTTMFSRMSDERKAEGETIDAYSKRKTLNAAGKSAAIKRYIEKSDINLKAEQLTMGQVKELLSLVIGPEGLNLRARNNAALNTLQKRRAELRSQIKNEDTMNVNITP